MSESPRHLARELAMKGLYAFENGQENIDEILDKIVFDKSLSEKNLNFARNLFKVAVDNIEWADKQIEALAENWDIDRIATIDLIILRLGLVELEKFVDIPVKVVLNEAIELAKTYSTSQSFSFINGILDKRVKMMEESKET